MGFSAYNICQSWTTYDIAQIVAQKLRKLQKTWTFFQKKKIKISGLHMTY